MEKIDILLLDISNNLKKEIPIIKPKTYQLFFDQIGSLLEIFPGFSEIFILDKNNNEININCEEKYNKIDDILFIREIDNNNNSKLSRFTENFNELSESKQNALEQKYSCGICFELVKNENPYFCYKCQIILHEKCLKDWDKKCKKKGNQLSCPKCRKELALNQWNKKLNYEDSRIKNGDILEELKINKLKINMNNIIIQIKNKKIIDLTSQNSELNETLKKQRENEEKNKKIILNLLQRIKSLHSLMKLSVNNKLNHLINTTFSINYDNNIEDISNIIDEEFEKFNNYIINKSINAKIIKNNININPKNIIKNINIKNSPISLNNTINSFRYKQIPHPQTEKKENEYNQNHFNLTFNSNKNNNNENITKYNVDREIKNINRKNLKKDFLSSDFSKIPNLNSINTNILNQMIHINPINEYNNYKFGTPIQSAQKKTIYYKPLAKNLNSDKFNEIEKNNYDKYNYQIEKKAKNRQVGLGTKSYSQKKHNTNNFQNNQQNITKNYNNNNRNNLNVNKNKSFSNNSRNNREKLANSINIKQTKQNKLINIKPQNYYDLKRINNQNIIKESNISKRNKITFNFSENKLIPRKDIRTFNMINPDDLTYNNQNNNIDFFGNNTGI